MNEHITEEHLDFAATSLRVEQPEVGRKKHYRPELDALRFLAFMGVFIHHSHITGLPLIAAAGGFGLSLFFVLSAFLITSLLEEEMQETGTVNVKAFYIRRILRIWPLYYGFVLFAFAVGKMIPPLHVNGGMFWSYIFMYGNFYAIYHPNINFISIITPLWSISIEEQFYLAWPHLVKFLSLKRMILFSSALILMSWGFIAVLSWRGARPGIEIWMNSLVVLQMFGIGSLLSIFFREKSLQITSVTRVMLLCFGLACWLIAVKATGVQSLDPQPALKVIAGYILAGLGCLSLLIAALNAPRKLIPKSAIYLGKISYGLYVFHPLALLVVALLMHASLRGLYSSHIHLFDLCRIALSFALDVLLAAVSFHLFETRFLRLKRRFTVIPSR